MYLSRIEIDRHRRETIRALTSLQVLHAAIEACFPDAEGEKPRRLWRVDSLHNALHLLLQSEIEPDFTHIARQFGRPGQTWETRAYDEFLSGLQDGQLWKFRLQANPTRSVSLEKGARGKVTGHSTTAWRKKWLTDRAAKCGFEIERTLGGDLIFDVTQSEIKKFWRQGETVTIDTAVFEGVLRIVDAEALALAMKNGVGRAKAYGCGLLTLARYCSDN
jgi:CRISPR system Cascade subunit CasE